MIVINCRIGGSIWDLFVFVYFLSLKQRLRPLGFCAPLFCGILTYSLYLIVIYLTYLTFKLPLVVIKILINCPV